VGRRVPSLESLFLEISDLAIDGYLLAMQQFGAFILMMLYIGNVDSVKTTAKCCQSKKTVSLVV